MSLFKNKFFIGGSIKSEDPKYKITSCPRYSNNKNSKRTVVIVKAFNAPVTPVSTPFLKDYAIDQEGLFRTLIGVGLTAVGITNMQLTDIYFLCNGDVAAFKTKYAQRDLSGENLMEILKDGMKFYPALVYLSTPPEKRNEINVLSNESVSFVFSQSDFLTGFFLSMFFLYTTGQLPTDDTYKPKILVSMFGNLDNYHILIMNVWSCNLGKLNNSWIKDFPWGAFPQKLTNRFALASAGYRIINAFGSAELIPSTPEKVKKVQQVCKLISGSPPDWDVHPITRNPNLISKYGSLNKSLEGLLAKWGDPAWIVKNVQSRVLYATPADLAIDDKIYLLDIADFTRSPISLTRKPSSSELEDSKKFVFTS